MTVTNYPSYPTPTVHQKFCIRLAWSYDIGVEMIKAESKHTCLM